MTISEQLRFSILSAPVASADRRALSQAWYSALYREPQPPPHPHGQSRANAVAGAAPQAIRKPAPPAASLKRAERQFQTFAGRNDLPAAPERRAPRLYLARRIAHLALRRAPKRSAATFVLDGTEARVRVLVTVKGGRVQLIAVCAKQHERRVAAALAQARYAAAASGIALQTDRRGAVRC